jgi:UDP-N-acetylglucosamine 1-carboxyvinyltransferase
MDKLIIRGGNRLSGTIPISGAKNAALTLIPCAILTDEPVTLRNLPRLADIDGFQHLMGQFGVTVSIQGNNRPEDFGRIVTYQAARVTSTVAPYDLVRKMRASILVLGPMLARAGEATVSMPGGCAIGNRPIDLISRRSKRSVRRSNLPRATSKPWRLMAACRVAILTFPSCRSARQKTR